MKVNELFAKVNNEKPNSFSDADLISYLNEIEADIAEELALYDIPVYTADNMNVELTVPAPYDCVYVSYLKARIDFANEEMDVYANDQAQFVQDYMEFSAWVTRTGQALERKTPRRLRNIF